MNIDALRDVMPAIRPSYRIQLTPDVRTLDVERITPFLLKGEVTQKFDQSSTMTFVTQPVFSMRDAQAQLQTMQEADLPKPSSWVNSTANWSMPRW